MTVSTDDNKNVTLGGNSLSNGRIHCVKRRKFWCPAFSTFPIIFSIPCQTIPTFNEQSRLLTTLKEMAFENIVGKGKKKKSRLFPTMFSTLSNTEILILPAFNLLSANAFNLAQC